MSTPEVLLFNQPRVIHWVATSKGGSIQLNTPSARRPSADAYLIIRATRKERAMEFAKGIVLRAILLLMGSALTSCLISNQPVVLTSDRPFASWTLVQQGCYDNITREWLAGPAASITAAAGGYLFQSKNRTLPFNNIHFLAKQLSPTIYLLQTYDRVFGYMYGAMLLGSDNLIFIRTYETAHTCDDVFSRDQIIRLGLLRGQPREDPDFDLSDLLNAKPLGSGGKQVTDCIAPSPNALAALILEDAKYNKRADWYAFKVLKIS